MVANLSFSSASTPAHFRETFPALLDSLQTTQTMLSEYTSMSQSRDSWYARQLRKEKARQDVWEESLRVVVKEGENLEQELRRGVGIEAVEFSQPGVLLVPSLAG
jgi:hypothetical protein